MGPFSRSLQMHHDLQRTVHCLDRRIRAADSIAASVRFDVLVVVVVSAACLVGMDVLVLSVEGMDMVVSVLGRDHDRAIRVVSVATNDDDGNQREKKPTDQFHGNGRLDWEMRQLQNPDYML